MSHRSAAALRMAASCLMTLCLGGVSLGAGPVQELRRPAVFPPLRATGDGPAVSGRLVAWSFDGFWLAEGDRGRAFHAWDGFREHEVYGRIRGLILDGRGDDPAQWARLAGLMLRLGTPELERNARARLAVRAARRHGAPESWLEAIQTPPHVLPMDRQADAAPGGGGPAGPAPPDARGAVAGLDAWPALADDQRLLETERLKARTGAELRAIGLSAQAVETKHFLVYSGAGRDRLIRWAATLERMQATLLSVFGLARDAELYHGKCVVLVFRKRADFLAYQAAQGFDGRAVRGVCRLRGPDCVVSLFLGDEGAAFESALVHEAVHAFMYRYRSPRSLPAWANEGLADYIAGRLVPGSGEPGEHRAKARAFLEAGGDAAAIMEQSYADGTWFDEHSYPVSHMLVQYMLRTAPAPTKAWIDDVKAGRAWREALTNRFGIEPAGLAQGFGADLLAEPEGPGPGG